jgi:poly(A) polymerase
MREIWDLQMRMDRRRHRKPLEFASNKRFRAAYDFLLLRAEAGEPLQDIARWWTEFQDKNPQLHELRAAQPAEEPVKRRRPPRRRRRPS